jgi:hypothetical protein
MTLRPRSCPAPPMLNTRCQTSPANPPRQRP